ncbi:MAG: hypothetical protein Aureis2KO_32870 [Aureisphaera sp.]
MAAQMVCAQNISTAEVTSNSNYTRMNSVYVVGAHDEDPSELADVKGSPYLYDNYRIGAILQGDEVVAPNVALRYNVHKDVFTGKVNLNADDKKVHNVIKSTDYNIRIGSELFTLGNGNTYYQVVHSGEKSKLLKKYSKSFHERIQATTSLTRAVPAMYKDKLAYYFVNAQGVYIEAPTSKKKFLKLFGEQQDMMKKFMKENKTDLSKDADLKELFEYYESL